MELYEIAKKIHESKRTSKEKMRKMILQLCLQDFINVHKLGLLLNRKEKTLREAYLQELVKEGRLILKYPNNINHPDQAYKTVSSSELDL